jgi:hypothetical protein
VALFLFKRGASARVVCTGNINSPAFVLIILHQIFGWNIQSKSNIHNTMSFS